MSQREKYRVISKLDAGGMAEVFLGQAESLEGFQKRVAIKRVLPHLAENRKFLAMFLDEARLSLSFNHANVVQTFDIGRSGETYFVVMEYVDGTNLKRLIETLRDREQLMPVELAVFIGVEICRGLAYAHAFKDHKGNRLEIVHRDVSPPNILLSRQGEVKIVDFGLAKATSQLEATDPGVVKGKFAYLSPEAAHAKPVDHRADIFACGIILWELLTGKRLFLGENDVQTVELVRAAEVPAVDDFNPTVPKSLEKIILKALSYEPGTRYSSCNNLAEALAGFLFEYGRKVTAFDVARLVEDVAPEESATEVAKPSIIDQLIQEELSGFSSLDANDDSFTASSNGKQGAAPLNPAGFGEMRESSTSLPPYSPDVAGGDLSDSWSEANDPLSQSSSGGIQVQDPALGAGEQDGEAPSLAQMLEGEVRMGTIPPVEETRNRAFLIGMTVVTAAIVASALAAYFMGWIP